MRTVMMAIKVLAVAVGVAACALMANRFGPWKALAMWAAIMGALCVAIALVVHRQAPGKVTIVNYIMGIVLQWGYRIGRGKLPAIVATSWCIWVLLGAAVVIAINARVHDATASHVTTVESETRSTTVMTLLILAWIVDGAVLLRIIGLFATSANASHMLRSLGPTFALLIIMIGGSVALVTLNHSPAAARTALLLAGGPPLLVGVGYGLFVLVILTAGRNTRWN